MGALLRLFGLPVPPAAAEDGDVWYDTAADQILASDGQPGLPLTIGPTGNAPTIRSGAWHKFPAYGANGTANVPADRMFALPIWPGRACTLTGIAANVTLALAGGQIRMGLYASDGVIPTSLVADYGTVSADISGVRQITSMSTALRPVLYYLIAGRQGGVLNLGLTTLATGDPIVSESSPAFTGSLNAYYMAGVSGTLPSTFTVSGTDTGPALQVRLS